MSPWSRLFIWLYNNDKSRPVGRLYKGGEGGKGAHNAEHVAVCAHRVVIHEQVVSEGFLVEVAGKVAHLAFEIVALADDVPGEVFFAIPLAAVGSLEVVFLVGVDRLA